MKKEWLIIDRTGFSLVEALLASAIFVLLVTMLSGAYFYGQESAVLAGNTARATMFAEEGIEAVRNIRDGGFYDLSDGTYGLAVLGGEWTFSGSEDQADIFSRQVVISSIDVDRKNATVNVSWQQNGQRSGSIALTTEITSWAFPRSVQ